MRTALMINAAALVLAALPGHASAGFTCGGTVWPGGTVTMATDISACSTNPALTIVGPVTVEMAGHHFECIGLNQTGINIIGTGAVVKRGLVFAGCQHQIVLAGSGYHEIDEMFGHQAGDNPTGANAVTILVFSDHNVVRRSVAATSGGDGIQVVGSENVIRDNYVVNSGRDGVRVLGDVNGLYNNLVTLSHVDGFHLMAGSDNNALTNNTAVANVGAGFRSTTVGSRFSGNGSVGNGFGFSFGVENDSPAAGSSGHNWILNNSAVYNAAPLEVSFWASSTVGGGFRIAEGRDVVQNNRAFFNLPFLNQSVGGISVLGPQNIISDNTSLFHMDEYDLRDDTAGCGTDHWSSNVFASKNHPCIH